MTVVAVEDTMDLPIVKPTELEHRIWQRLRPVKTGGLLRMGSVSDPYDLPECCYGPRDKTNPDHWDCKTRGGVDAEWWVYMMAGARRVLDVGCGFGFPSFYLASHGFEVVGVDPSPSEIAAAEQYRLSEGAGLPLSYAVTEQDHLPFVDASFDGATFSGSIATAGDPEVLAREVIRVLKPGSRVAFDEEDRALEPRTHPVAENTQIVCIDGTAYLWVESRTFDPYLDRRYMVRLSDGFRVNAEWRRRRAAGTFLPTVGLDEAGLSVEDVLEHALEAEYGEAVGHDANSLREFVEKVGFTDLHFWARANGRRFAEELETLGVLRRMPDDFEPVLRAIARSLPPLTTATTLISCRTPGGTDLPRA